MKIKTIDIIAKEWFDKANGNSYFAANITLNFGLSDCQNIFIPFKYGYGDNYIYTSFDELINRGFIKNENSNFSVWKFCNDNNIIFRNKKYENCKKRDLVNF